MVAARPTIQKLFEEPQVLIKLYFKDEQQKEFVCTDYQERIIKACFPKKDNYIQIVAATQSGKSEAIAILACLYMLFYPGERVAVVSYTKDQSEIIFSRAKQHLLFDHPELAGAIDHGQEFTKRTISLMNGSEMRCFTASIHSEGEQILGFNATTLIIDESGSITDYIYYQKIMRMVAAARTRRVVIESGTPHRKNHFYETWKSPLYKKIHVSWRDAVKAGQMREDHVLYLKSRMSGIEFKMWYEAEFPEEVEDTLIKWSQIEAAIAKYEEMVKDGPTAGVQYFDVSRFYGACDVARYGVDETVRCCVEVKADTSMYLLRALEATHRKPTTDTAGRIELDAEIWQFSQYTVDDTGVGGGVTDILRNGEVGKVVYPFIAGGRPQHSRRFLNAKSEGYFFLAKLFEEGKIAVSNDDRLIAQLSQMRYEVMLDKRLKVLDPGEKPVHEKGATEPIHSPDRGDALMMCVYPTYFSQPIPEEFKLKTVDDFVPIPSQKKERWKTYAGY